jgi:hypothetical protein
VYPDFLVKASQNYEYSLRLIPLNRLVDEDADVAEFAHQMRQHKWTD